MAELGIDLSSHRSKTVDEATAEPVDIVVTVCDNAREACPFVPARKLSLHRRFEDPSAVKGGEEEQLAAFRRARDEIGEWLEGVVGRWGESVLDE